MSSRLDNVEGSPLWRVKCPVCAAGKGQPCVYTATTSPYTSYSYAVQHPGRQMPGQVKGEPTRRVHHERGWVYEAWERRRRQQRWRQENAPTPQAQDVLDAAHAMRAWDVEEYSKLRDWLAEHGDILVDAALPRRPDGTVRGDSYALPSRASEAVLAVREANRPPTEVELILARQPNEASPVHGLDTSQADPVLSELQQQSGERPEEGVRAALAGGKIARTVSQHAGPGLWLSAGRGTRYYLRVAVGCAYALLGALSLVKGRHMRLGWTRTERDIPTWTLDQDRAYCVEQWGLGSWSAYYGTNPIGQSGSYGTRTDAQDAAEDAYSEARRREP
jgi:hypothetical protein